MRKGSMIVLLALMLFVPTAASADEVADAACPPDATMAEADLAGDLCYLGCWWQQFNLVNVDNYPKDGTTFWLKVEMCTVKCRLTS